MASPDLRENNIAYFVRPDNESKLEFLNKECRRLLGSEAFADPSGDIYFISYRDLPKDGFLPDKYVLVSRTDPHATIYSAHSSYEFKELRVNHVTKDGGSVEAAIRAIDHILEGERGREAPQTRLLAHRAGELLDLFHTDFSSVTSKDFAAAQERTYKLLHQVKLNPDRVVDEEKRKIAEWIIKGSFGQDSLGRRNWLISTMALSAAYRHAIEKYKGIGIISGKFIRMHEALIFEREFSRELFADVLNRLRPEAIPAHKLFKHPDSPADNVGIVIGILNTMRFQLRQPHVKPYKPIGREAEAMLAQAVTLLTDGQRKEIVRHGLFPEAYALIKNGLV